MKTFDEIVEEKKYQLKWVGKHELYKNAAKEYASQAIDEAAEKAECKNEGTYGGDGELMDYYVVDKQSILKVKNELK